MIRKYELRCVQRRQNSPRKIIAQAAVRGLNAPPLLRMNIHEYQAKELLEKFGVATSAGSRRLEPGRSGTDRARTRTERSRGESADSRRRAREGDLHERIQRRRASVQIAGGSARNRGQDARPNAGHASDRRRWSRGQQSLVAESAEIAREIYFAILLDRATAAPLIVASTEGGVEIEAVAAKSPEKIIREPIDPLAGIATVSNAQTGEGTRV